VALAAAGLGLGLMGSGVRAAFTDSATAQENVSVGTMGINVSSTTAGAVVSPDKHSVTLSAGTIQSSSPGQDPLSFTVTNVGSMPVTVTVSSNGGAPAFAAPWSDLFSNPGAEVIAPAGSYTYSGGIAWSTLSNADLGSSHSVTYTISATA
jgi:predicted ribosomally synthesized peptide with SipW-like signal peptide